MSMRLPVFRSGKVLATRFTGTLTERHGTPVERIPTPQRLIDWLKANGLAVDACTTPQLDLARELRESIHITLTAMARGEELPASAVQVINDCSVLGGAVAHLTLEGERQWRLNSDSGVADALGVIAADAISVLAGERDGRLALCVSPSCQAAFLDTSQSRTRRWCDMNTCGSRHKKARFIANHRNNPASVN
jgi:predicted RNA-binding Zn ribbon-like protein